MFIFCGYNHCSHPTNARRSAHPSTFWRPSVTWAPRGDAGSHDGEWLRGARAHVVQRRVRRLRGRRGRERMLERPHTVQNEADRHLELTLRSGPVCRENNSTLACGVFAVSSWASRGRGNFTEFHMAPQRQMNTIFVISETYIKFGAQVFLATRQTTAKILKDLLPSSDTGMSPSWPNDRFDATTHQERLNRPSSCWARRDVMMQNTPQKRKLRMWFQVLQMKP